MMGIFRLLNIFCLKIQEMGSLERKLWKPELVQTADPREAKMSQFILKPVLLMELW